MTHPPTSRYPATPSPTPCLAWPLPQPQLPAALWLVTPRIVAVTVFVCGFDAFSRFANAFFFFVCSPSLFAGYKTFVQLFVTAASGRFDDSVLDEHVNV